MARRLPPLNALRTFECAGRHLSFVQAAYELNVTPGAVSRQIKALEAWLGSPLFERRHKRVVLTGLGRRYLEAISEPFDRIANATQLARREDPSRALSICSYPTFALRWLVPRWGRFYDRHPDIDVQITTSFRPVDFDTGEFDAAVLVAESPAAWPGLEALPLIDVELMPVCSPKLMAGPNPLREPSDLAQQTLLHGAPRPQDWRRWLEHTGVAGVDPDGGLSFESLNLSIQAAIEGIGVAIAIKALVADDLAAGRLVQPFPQTRISGRPFFLVYPPERAADRRLRAFIDWLREEVGAAA